MRKVLPQNKRGLEIGVGTGRFAAGLGIATGIDPSRNMLEVAQGRGVNVREGFGEDLPFPNEAFDYAALIITLCFVKKPKKVLEEARRILRKDGRIIIGIVDRESFLGKFYRKKKSVFYEQARFLGVGEVTNMLKEAGFAAFSYFQTISVLPERMISVEKPRRGFGKGGFVVVSAKKTKRQGSHRVVCSLAASARHNSLR
jgi:ubiquinone/menaquinone biosynthesis C-methylase UbiE